MPHIPGHRTAEQILQDVVDGVAPKRSAEDILEAVIQGVVPSGADEVIRRQGAAPEGLGIPEFSPPGAPIFERVQPSNEGSLLKRFGGEVLDRAALAPLGGGSLSKTLEGAELVARPFQAFTEGVTGAIGLLEAGAKKLGIPERVADPLNISSDIFLRPELSSFSDGRFFTGLSSVPASSCSLMCLRIRCCSIVPTSELHMMYRFRPAGML